MTYTRKEKKRARTKARELYASQGGRKPECRGDSVTITVDEKPIPVIIYVGKIGELI